VHQLFFGGDRLTLLVRQPGDEDASDPRFDLAGRQPDDVRRRLPVVPLDDAAGVHEVRRRRLAEQPQTAVYRKLLTPVSHAPTARVFVPSGDVHE
jgi:hypothetical protein